MYIDKIIKREFLALLVCVIVLIIFVIGFSYSYFFNISTSEDIIINTSNIKIDICVDNKCDNNSNIIGTNIVDDKVYPKNIYPYMNEIDAINTIPYIFNIKNSGSLDVNLNIKLTSKSEEYNNSNDFVDASNLYNEYIMIGLSSCDEEIDRENVKITNYKSLNDNCILNDIELNINEDKTYCLWTWLDKNTPNSIQNSYFIARISAEAFYVPKRK